MKANMGYGQMDSDGFRAIGHAPQWRRNVSTIRWMLTTFKLN
jgi:hypothetical protein